MTRSRNCDGAARRSRDEAATLRRGSDRQCDRVARCQSHRREAVSRATSSRCESHVRRASVAWRSGALFAPARLASRDRDAGPPARILEPIRPAYDARALRARARPGVRDRLRLAPGPARGAHRPAGHQRPPRSSSPRSTEPGCAASSRRPPCSGSGPAWARCAPPPYSASRWACSSPPGLVPRAGLLVLWALYLSFLGVGDVFLGYQWDTLLVETCALAAFYAPGGWRLREARPSPSGRILLGSCCSS